jgi:endonuclease/exonuclease/phosphatase family metal-dependent hydrolase
MRVLAIVAGQVAAAQGAGLPILTDGYFDDWTIGPILTDPSGDGGPSGIDFAGVWAAEDPDFLYIRFQTTAEILLQEGNDVALYLDTDSNTDTGVLVGGIGAEVRWRFGGQTGTFYGNPPPDPITWEDIRLRAGLSVSATEFEISIGRDVRPDGVTPLFSGDDIRIFIRDETSGGDSVPDDGEFMAYSFTNDGPPAGVNSMDPESPDDLRLMTYNVHFDSPWDSGQDARFDRILSAIVPEVVCFQEIYDHSPAETRQKMESWLPSGAGESWQAFGNADLVMVSRYEFLGSWAVGSNHAGFLDTDAKLGRDLLVINTHLPCCDDDAGRRLEIDQVLSFIRDAMSSGGAVTLPEGTGIVVTGDMNLVGDGQQLVSILTGDVSDEGTYGPDFAPDWDGTETTDLPSSQTEIRETYTWRNDSSSFLPGRLDMVIFTDSALRIGNHFTLYTPNMSPEELAAAGLLEDDIPQASDHLPHVADLGDPSSVGIAQAPGPRAWPLSIVPNPARAAVALALPIGDYSRVRVDVFDAAGRVVRRLEFAGGSPVRLDRVLWDGRARGGAEPASGTYFLRVEAVRNGVPFAATGRVTLVR